MGFLLFNLTPHLYIVFNLILTSHFDAIPLKSAITEAVLNYEGDN